MTVLKGPACAAAVFNLLIGSAACTPADGAPVWKVPDACTDGVTGDEFEEPPVVEYYVGGEVQDGAVTNVAWSKGAGKATIFEQRDSSDLYLVAVTYTPFLVGTMAVTVNFSGGRKIITRLPQAGIYSSAQNRVIDSLTVTINDLSGHPMPGATVLWDPYFTGADPYTTTADSHGQMVINCVQSLQTGYSVYIISQDGSNEFASTVRINNNLTAQRGEKTSGRQTVWTASN